MPKMKEDRLQAVIKAEISSSVGFMGGSLSNDRRDSLDMYYQEPIGGELAGRSQYVTSDVQDTVESLMPDLMEIFAGGEEIVRFSPRKEEDIPMADQSTEYVNYIWNNDNDGFGVTHDFIKDALLQKNGVMKIWWDETPVQTRETLTGLNSLALQTLDADENIEILEHDEREATAEELPFAPDGLVHDLTILKTEQNGKVRLAAIPPEEFLIGRRATDLEDADFTCHKVKKTRSQLIRMGFSKKEIDDLPAYSEQDFNEERVNRFGDEDWPDGDKSLDPAQEEIWLYEVYLLVDWDGDGVSEMRQVTVAGPGYKILDNQPVDDHPFVSVTPIRMPHKFFGRSMADLVADIQLVKTSLTRNLLDNLYFLNNGRMGVSNRVNLEDMLTPRPGGVVRIDSDAPDVQNHIAPIVTQPLGQVVLPALEYFDTIRETRTGVTRYNQGLDANSLNKTATGISQILNQSQRRLMLIARLFAETGFRPGFRKILRLVINHQDRPRVIRLRNEWVEMDPRNWDVNMDVSIMVGLGHGTQQQRAMTARMMLEVQERVIQYQGGIEGPLVSVDNLHNALKSFEEANGFKGHQFFMDPSGFQPKPKEPSPEQQQAQAELQLEGKKVENEGHKLQIAAQEKSSKLQLEGQKLQQEQENFAEEMKLKWAEFEAKYNIEGEKLRLAGSKAQMDSTKAESDYAIKQRQAAAAERKAEMDAVLEEARIAAELRKQDLQDSRERKPEGRTIDLQV